MLSIRPFVPENLKFKIMLPWSDPLQRKTRHLLSPNKQKRGASPCGDMSDFPFQNLLPLESSDGRVNKTFQFIKGILLTEAVAQIDQHAAQNFSPTPLLKAPRHGFVVLG